MIWNAGAVEHECCRTSWRLHQRELLLHTLQGQQGGAGKEMVRCEAQLE